MALPTRKSVIETIRDAAFRGAAKIISAETALAAINHALAAPRRDGGGDRVIDWRMRDSKLINSVKIHPRTTEQIHDDVNEIFPSAAMLYRRLRRLRRRGLIKHQGTIQIKDAGRPTDYYCSWPVPRGKELHELELTDVCDMIGGEWKRGRPLSSEANAEKKFRDEAARELDPNAKATKTIWPDAILVRGGVKYWVEWDMGDQSGRQIEEKFDAYAGFRHRLLFITRGGMERLRHVAELARPIAAFTLFSTYDLIMDSEAEEIWYGVSLKKAVALPR